ncbi:carboxypeptidase-like regulatory domain-containing protein [Flavobacteriaceae bacterium]|nr:carboxypeptidase-like regulatory domain-containing protein [Flavobacteriaceae bacterium]
MRIYFTLVLLLASSIGLSQVKLQGVVRDSLGSPLELANVIAINKQSSALESFSVTSEDGKFLLSLSKNQTYNMQVSYIGMKTFEQEISTQEQDITKDFNLSLDNNLDAVELSYEMPVTVRGDTLIYNADSFTNGSERKLEDVLKNLPGVEINEDGQIEVEGKVVNKLMVNGKDFFDGDTKLASKNIPSKAVDKIQVLRNYSEVGQLSGVTNNQDNVAINIKLKEGKENFWFGTVTAGGGVSEDEPLYLVQPKLFYYSPKFSLNFIGDLNNTGETALSRRDIRGFGGGFRAPSSTSGTSINLGDNSLNFLTNQKDALEVKNQLGATNFSYSPSQALDITGFAILNSNRVTSREISVVQYTDSDLGIPDETTQQTSTQRSDQGLLKLSASFQPNFENQLEYDVLGRISKDEQRQTEVSSVVGPTQQVDQVNPYSITQGLKYYYTLNENNIFALEAQYLNKDEDPFYNVLLGNDPDNNDPLAPEEQDAYDSTARALGLNQGLNNYNINQDRRIKSNQLDAKLDYYNIINNKSNINLTLGSIVSRQDFNSNIFQFLEDGSFFEPTPTFNQGRATNDTQYDFSDMYLGVHYRFKAGMFTITPGFSVHAYSNKNIQFGEQYSEDFFRILPDFETRIQLKKSESLTFNYNMKNQFTDVTKLAEGIILNSFNNIQYGNPELQNALSHNLSLFYRSFNLFNYTNVFARIAYSKNIDQIRSLTDFENVIRTSTYFNSGFADETVTAFGRMQRTFGKIRGSLSVNLNYSKINQFVQERLSVNEGFTQSYTPSIRTTFKVAPNVTLRYRHTIAQNDQGTSSTTFITNAPSIEFDAYIKKAFTLRSDFTYNRLSDDVEEINSFQTWNASLSYRKDKDARLEYEVRATNILGIDSQVQNSASNISVFTSETFIQPRFVTFRLVYSL